VFSWEFRDPWFLLVALAAPLVFWLATRNPATVRYSSLVILDSTPRTLRARLAKLPAVLLALSVIILAIALAGPRTPDAETRVSREGIAIMMVIDRSSSMNARDLVPENLEINRLTVVKDVFRCFVLGDKGVGEGRKDDTVGLVAFARYADSLCPLTLDHGNLATLVDDLEIVQERAEDGTAIGDGLALAVERLRRNQAKSRIAILLTDGVNNAGVIDPRQAADLAASHDIKVYCIGAGTEGFAPVPAVTFFGRRTFRRMYVEIDEETLRAVADKTGGRYYRATDEEALARIYQEIDQLERTKVTEFRYLQYHEHYAGFVLAGLGLIGVASILNGTVLRRIP
jgi:Ca-activated chloride channel family protein